MSPIAVLQHGDSASHGTELSKNPHVKSSEVGTEKLVINTIRCLAADLCQQVSNILFVSRQSDSWGTSVDEK